MGWVDARDEAAVEHLEAALETATDEDARVHVRQALQLLQAD